MNQNEAECVNFCKIRKLNCRQPAFANLHFLYTQKNINLPQKEILLIDLSKLSFIKIICNKARGLSGCCKRYFFVPKEVVLLQQEEISLASKI